MKVRSVMTSEVQACRPQDNLAAAAMIMWHHDCGVVPVIDSEHRPVGVLTDRDICMAITLKDRPASAIPVGETMATDISSVNPDDDVDDALKLMSARQIRRLLVVDSDGRLNGILSTSDIVRHTDKGKSKKHISNKDTMKMLHAVSKPHLTPSAEVTEVTLETEVVTAPEPAPAETAAPL